jgi:hypothetical protein
MAPDNKDQHPRTHSSFIAAKQSLPLFIITWPRGLDVTCLSPVSSTDGDISGYSECKPPLIHLHEHAPERRQAAALGPGKVNNPLVGRTIRLEEQGDRRFSYSRRDRQRLPFTELYQ